MHLQECQETFLRRGGAENPQQIVLKMENLDQERQKGLIMVFAETVSFDNKPVEPKELWNWIENMCKQCVHDSSEEQCLQQSLEILETIFTDPDKFNRIKQHPDSPIAGHPG